jgi:hypothetical protein
MTNFKILNQVLFPLIICGLLFYIFYKNEAVDPPHFIPVVAKEVNATTDIKTFDCTIAPGNWQKLSSVERCAQILLPALTSDIISKGSIKVYLCEKEKSALLPVTYYQVRFISSVQASYEEGWVYIHVLGNSILNCNALSDFRIVLLTESGAKALNDLNWDDYEVVKKPPRLIE